MKEVVIGGEVSFMDNVFTDSVGMHNKNYYRSKKHPEFTDFIGMEVDGSKVLYFMGRSGKIKDAKKGREYVSSWELQCLCGNYFRKRTCELKLYAAGIKQGHPLRCSECDKREYAKERKCNT